jgi:hypothetical protein
MRTIASGMVVLLALLAWEGRSSRVLGECISLNESLEQAFMRFPLVFVGDVLGVDNVLQPESYRQRVRFRVIEAYRGIERGERAVLFRPGAEDFKFEASQRVLVYASGTRDNYSTQCTATRVVTLEDAALQELRRLARK